VDIEPRLLEFLALRARRDGLRNVRTVLATPSDSGLAPGCCDLLFLCNTLYLIRDRPAYLRHLAGRLRPQGRIAIIDWRPGASPGMGPREEHKLAVDQVAADGRAAGLCVVARHDLLALQHFTILSACAPGPGGEAR
jgi:SAM-dependent methyltransferase